ncbi:MAG TPA: ABC transporter permease [Chloroflexia bacterium]|nr:ABC transporter permease [Chloroflexia bacterium]
MRTEQIPLDVEMTPAGQAVAMPTVAPSGMKRLVWLRNLTHNRKALLGFCIVTFFVLVAVFAPFIAPGDPTSYVSRPNLEPSAQYIFGTEGQGKDVFRQTVWGARVSLTIGFATGALTTLIGLLIGLSSGYFRGKIDDLLSLVMNLFLVIPGLPLLVVISAYLRPSMWTIVLALAFTGWAWPARVMRSQMLSLREKDFVSASVVSGESNMRIIFLGILPNMASIIVGSMIGSVNYAIGTEAALGALGLTNVSDVSWGTNLYWAQNNAGLFVGAWWTFIPSGLCIALVAFGLSLLNYGMDEITNPRLRAERDLNNVLKDRTLRNIRATPVVRRSH